MTIERFENMDGWKKGRELTCRVYAVSRKINRYYTKD